MLKKMPDMTKIVPLVILTTHNTHKIIITPRLLEIARSLSNA